MEWRLFIDFTIRSLKAVLLHTQSISREETRILNSAGTDQIPYPQSVFMRPYQDLWNVVRTKRSTHKFAIFPCEWNITARDIHWTRKGWPKREDLIPGYENVVQDNQKILLPPLTIKIGITEQFVKALDRGGHASNTSTLSFSLYLKRSERGDN